VFSSLGLGLQFCTFLVVPRFDCKIGSMLTSLELWLQFCTFLVLVLPCADWRTGLVFFPLGLSINQLTNESIDERNNQPINQSTNQPTNRQTYHAGPRRMEYWGRWRKRFLSWPAIERTLHQAQALPFLRTYLLLMLGRQGRERCVLSRG
jgi:hypothetical protein